MTGTTKTGLSVSPRKQIARSFKVKTDTDNFKFYSKFCSFQFVNSQNSLPCAITKPATLSLRPFGGLYNPYHSKGCSVLCNHPASNEMKNIVRMAKDAWVSEKKTKTLSNSSQTFHISKIR
jgi:hypothetical protein